jgi:transcriptional regulator with XRE-family HTH domain
MPTFGELLRRLRGSRSQREVAVELDMPVTTLSTLENQEVVPRGAVLKKFADYYGVPLTYFYPPATSEPRATDSAREWLKFVSRSSQSSDGIATHAPPEYPDDIKKRFAEIIREKKHAKTRNED